LIALGAIDWRVSPQNAGLTYQRSDESQAQAADNGKQVSVRAGRYNIRATANGYSPQEDTMDVEPGKVWRVELSLKRIEEPKKAQPAPPCVLLTKDYFHDQETWKQQGTWWVHQGEGVSWLCATQGVFVIEVLRETAKIGFIKRTRHSEWIIDQKDGGDHLEYRFDLKNLERQATVGVKEEAKSKMAVPGAARDSYTLQIDINPDRIIVSGEGRELDRYVRPKASEPLGKFGFLGEVALVVRRASDQ
jgi:hypothetical protein